MSRARELPGESGAAPAVAKHGCGSRALVRRRGGGGGARPARARERERERERERGEGGGGVRGPRERERVGSEPTVPHQKGQCDREKAMKE